VLKEWRRNGDYGGEIKDKERRRREREMRSEADGVSSHSQQLYFLIDDKYRWRMTN